MSLTALDRTADLGPGIAEIAERLGITAHTVRYYERIGLVEIPRDSGGRRRFDQPAVSRIEFVHRLRKAGLSIRDIQHYLVLVRRGPDTIPERLAVMQRHRDEVAARIDDLQTALAVLDFKITTYGGNLPYDPTMGQS